jgi:hypothetical protein
VIAKAKALARPGTGEAQRQEIIRSFLLDRDSAGEVLLGVLDFRKAPDQEERLGAIRGLQVVKPSGARVSAALAWSATMDPVPQIREACVALIKELKDDQAVGGVIRHLLASYDGEGKVACKPVNEASVRALRAMDDPRIYSTLLYYVLCEMRPTVTELENFTTRQIDSYTINQGSAATVLLLLSFPIQFPELKITKVRTSVMVPATALKAVSGQDFGLDLNRWAGWIQNQKMR